MLIDIRTLIRQTDTTLDLDLVFPPEAFQLLREELWIKLPVSFVGQLHHTADGELNLTGTLKATVEGMCVRCLEPVTLSLETEVNEIFLPEKAALDAIVAAAALGDTDFAEPYAYNGRSLDIEQALRDNLIPQLPEQPVCRADCSGLCPVCGADLDQNPCECQVEAAGKDSPFADLKILL
ncbi:MAG: YceD family protein [Saccharofermentanales bacterium]|jgi:uncharacterized metal-binding protein YceD (DUF177 family)